jgi:hypothetical protein
MDYKKLIGKLEPRHFSDVTKFDAEAFASLKEGLLKSKSNAWKMPVIFLASLALSFYFSAMGGAVGYGLAVVCIFAGLIGGNLSVLGISKQIKSAYKTLGITQGDINAAIKQVKQEAAADKPFETEPVPFPAAATPVSAAGKGNAAKKWLIVSGMLVILIHAFMVFMFIINAIDGDRKTGQYSLFAIGGVVAIAGAILMMRKRLWTFALVVLGIVLFCTGMGDELNADESITLFSLMIVFSVMLFFSALWLRRKERQAASGSEPEPFRLTRKHLLVGASAATAVILAVVLWPKSIYMEKYYYGYTGTPTQYKVQLRENGKWGVIDDSGQEVAPCKYDEIRSEYSFMKVKLGDRWGILDRAGKEIVPCKYDFIYDEVKNSNLISVELDGKKGYITTDWREVILPKYDDIEQYGDDSYRVRLDDKWGLIDRDGQEIIPIKYDEFLAGADLQSVPAISGKTARATSPRQRGNMKVEYDSKANRFTFLDAASGKPLKFNTLLVGGKKPVAMRYGSTEQAGSAIQFVWKEKEALGTRQEGGATVTTYSEESYTSFPLNNTFPYEIENEVLNIKR